MLTFSTGDIAIAFDVSPRTVCNWIDSGRLEGYRIPAINPTRKKPLHRRVTARALILFCQVHGMPIPTDMGLLDKEGNPLESIMVNT